VPDRGAIERQYRSLSWTRFLNLELVFINKMSQQDIIIRHAEIDPGKLDPATKYFLWKPSK